MKTLLACRPHYIRCIKPNENKKANTFDDPLVEHQVRYLGLVENVRVRRAGFANRQTYERFSRRYKILSKTAWPRFKGSSKQCVEAILKDNNINRAEYELGKTKVFIRNPPTLFYFEEEREKALPRVAVILQAAARGFMARRKYRKAQAARVIQLYVRKIKSEKYLIQLNSTFKNIRNDPQVGKNTIWPKAPSTLQQAEILVKKNI